MSLFLKKLTIEDMHHLPLNSAPAINKATEGIILNWRNNLDVLDIAGENHVDIELWAMTAKTGIKLLHAKPEVDVEE